VFPHPGDWRRATGVWFGRRETGDWDRSEHPGETMCGVPFLTLFPSRQDCS